MRRLKIVNWRWLINRWLEKVIECFKIESRSKENEEYQLMIFHNRK